MGKRQGLDATNYRGWIDENIVIDKKLSPILSAFLIGTPAYDVSKKGRDFVSFYKYSNASDYKQLLQDLTKGIDFQCFDTYLALKGGLLAEKIMSFESNIPDDLKEIIFMYCTAYKDDNLYKTFFKDTDKAIASDEKKVIVKINQLFKHLRNAFAHGSFAVVNRKNDTFYILQDEAWGDISARMILKESTLLSWIDYLENRRRDVREALENQKTPDVA